MLNELKKLWKQGIIKMNIIYIKEEMLMSRKIVAIGGGEKMVEGLFCQKQKKLMKK